MSIATAEQVLDSARTYLDDEMGVRWPDESLLPKLQEAHREMKTAFLLNGLPVINAVSTIMTVPALVTDDLNLDLSTVSGYPSDLLEPIWLKERQVGQMNRDFIDMVECDFIPNLDKQVNLIWWAWIAEKIILRGATVSNQVQLRYRRELTPPTKLTDSIGVLLGEIFLSYRIAAKAAEAMNDMGRKQEWDREAQKNLDTVIRAAVKEMQNLPAKRRPYHRGAGRTRVLRDF